MSTSALSNLKALAPGSARQHMNRALSYLRILFDLPY